MVLPSLYSLNVRPFVATNQSGYNHETVETAPVTPAMHVLLTGEGGGQGAGHWHQDPHPLPHN